MFGQIGRRTAHEARELELVIVVALGLMGALIAWFVLTSPFAGNAPASTSSATRAQVMPGHGMVMPHQVSVRASKGQLAVAMGDYWFKASSMRMRAGVYTFRAHNYGITAHDVMIERTPIKFSSPGMPIDEAAPYGLDDMDPGMTKTTRIALTPGRWEMFCSVPGHYMAGQHQTITVYGQMPRGTHMPKPGMDSEGMGSGGMDTGQSQGSMGMS